MNLLLLKSRWIALFYAILLQSDLKLPFEGIGFIKAPIEVYPKMLVGFVRDLKLTTSYNT